MTNIRQHKTTQ